MMRVFKEYLRLVRSGHSNMTIEVDHVPACEFGSMENTDQALVTVVDQSGSVLFAEHIPATVSEAIELEEVINAFAGPLEKIGRSFKGMQAQIRALAG